MCIPAGQVQIHITESAAVLSSCHLRRGDHCLDSLCGLADSVESCMPYMMYGQSQRVVCCRLSRPCCAGVNGAGKTTQLQIVMGRLQPDGGEIIKAKRHMKIAYLAQVRARAEGCGGAGVRA